MIREIQARRHKASLTFGHSCNDHRFKFNQSADQAIDHKGQRVDQKVGNEFIIRAPAVIIAVLREHRHLIRKLHHRYDRPRQRDPKDRFQLPF